MSIFNLTDKDSSFIGKVQAVDTANIVVKVENEDVLSNIQVNNLVIIQASKTRQTLIGMVNKIIRTYPDKTRKPIVFKLYGFISSKSPT